ncbi:putative F-box protein At1g47730 [Cajanus cajan]|uniref:putative F-box protein At1g47730 n=1 Tax=Cajanus cajan TaxID=3821 RepID=UPI00098DAFC3|nr:putative F-box protein At1g47730 [Cajanus cajan]
MVSTHFGYDPVRDKFKVLRMLRYYGYYVLKVFTIGVDSSWRDIAPEKHVKELLSRYYCVKRGLCVNGVIYWIYSYVFLMLFDVGTEQLRVIDLAPSAGYPYLSEVPFHYPDLVEIDCCLCVFKYKDSGMKLWILRDNEAQVWEEKSFVIPSAVVSPRDFVFPLCDVPTGEILLMPYFLSRIVGGVYYDMDTMKFRSVVLMEMPLTWMQRLGEVDIVFCQESFRLLK